MKKASDEKTAASVVREPEAQSEELIFEVDQRQLKAMLARRVVRRRALADSQRRMLESLIKQRGTADISELTRERLERGIRVNEDFAEFLSFASEHLVGRPGKRRFTASDLQVLDLRPRQTWE